MAQEIATWSKDPSTKTGAIVVDSCRRIVSTGYNGLPRGVMDLPERLENREMKYKFIVHADANAILSARVPLDGCTLYVVPFPPCCDCAKMVIQSGVTKVVCLDFPSDALANRWAESINISRQMFAEAGVAMVLVKPKV